MHIQKYTRFAAGHILRHNEPSTARAKRDNVDTKITHKNYAFVGGHGGKNLKKVLSAQNIYVNPRKDVNVLCSVCVTAPADLPKDREKEFFELSFQFLKDRYKNCPCVSAWIHYDEPNARPHLHYDFVPLVYDEKKQRYKVNAKSVVCKGDLQTLHIDFKMFIYNAMGLLLSILNGATENGNKTILELKNNTLKNELVRLKKLKKQVVNEIQQELCR